MYKHLPASLFLLLPTITFALVSPALLPTTSGAYSEWTPNSGGTHYTQVDESVCNGTTDYVATSTIGKRDSFGVSLSTLPNNSIITAITITPCASRALSGTGSSVGNVFYRYNASSSTDKGSYALSGTTPTARPTTTWNGLSIPKSSTSTLEIGMVYTSGTKGARLSRIATQLTYGFLPSATTTPASSITPTSALLGSTVNPNSSSTSAWFRIATTSPGTCSDTFGTRVPSTGSLSAGSGSSPVALSTTTFSLTPSTTYHYCSIASNAMGLSFGGLQSFTSSSSVTIITGNITATSTWSDAIYVIDGAISIDPGVTLTISPGVILKFKTTTSSLTNNGALRAEGTANSPILFTSYRDDTGGDTNGDTTPPAPQNWDSLYAGNTGSTTITHATIRYGGSGATGLSTLFQTNGGTTTIAHSTLSLGKYYGIRLHGGAFSLTNSTTTGFEQYGVFSGEDYLQNSILTITNSHFADNTLGAAWIPLQNHNLKTFVHSGNTATGTGIGGFVMAHTLDHDMTWTADGVPYVLHLDTKVGAGATLTLKPGVIVKAGNDGLGTVGALTIDGLLVSDASSTSTPLYFTSLKDDSVGGDTNGNGNTNTPAGGDWNWIRVNSGGEADMRNTIVRYGGYGSATIYNNGGVLTMYNSEVATGTTYGILNSTGTTTLTVANIHHHDTGIHVDVGWTQVGSSQIHNNASYGMNNTTGMFMLAQYNYWGDVSGPYHLIQNLFGTGNAVSNNVEFSPFLTQVHYLNTFGNEIQSSVGSKNINWNWMFGTPSSYASWWYSGMDTWKNYGTTVSGATFATSTGATSTADLLVYDTASSSADVFLAQYKYNEFNPDEVYFNPYWMNQESGSGKLNTTIHELGHALGLGHSYFNPSGNGNIMVSHASGTTTLGWQDMFDYDYLNTYVW